MAIGYGTRGPHFFLVKEFKEEEEGGQCLGKNILQALGEVNIMYTHLVRAG
jgi:hypothetical protein